MFKNTLALVALSTLSTVAWGSAYANNYSLTQEGGPHDVVITQQGTNNTGTLYQGVARNQLYVIQNGDTNNINTHQFGQDNILVSNVYGSQNDVGVIQGNQGAAAAQIWLSKVSANISGTNNNIYVSQQGSTNARFESYNNVSGSNNAVQVNQNGQTVGTYADNQVSGVSNIVNVTQNGNSRSQINVLANNNEVGLSQINSDSNAATENHFYANVNGSLNKLTTAQSGKSLTAGMDVLSSNNNIIDIRQINTSDSQAFATARDGHYNKINIFQLPAGSESYQARASVNAAGNNNEGYISQDGYIQLATSSMVGDGNHATINQARNNNVGWIDTIGNTNRAQINQLESTHAAAGITQRGNGNQGYITQKGDQHQGYISQTGNMHYADIMQNGAGFYANVTQLGAHNTVTAIQSAQ